MATPLQNKTFQGDSVAGGAQNLAMNSNFTAGSTAVLAITLYGNGTSSVVSVTMGGTSATKDKAHGDGGNNFVELWRAENVTGGTTAVVITLAAASGQFFTCGVDEWASGVFAATPVDANSGTATGSASTAPSATMAGAMAQANEISYAAFCDPTGTNWTSLTVPSGYTSMFAESNGSTHQAGGAAWKQLSAIVTETATFTTGAAMAWNCLIQTYKINAGSSNAPRAAFYNMMRNS